MHCACPRRPAPCRCRRCPHRLLANYYQVTIRDPVRQLPNRTAASMKAYSGTPLIFMGQDFTISRYSLMSVGHSMRYTGMTSAANSAAGGD